jgi:hypothetical protein
MQKLDTEIEEIKSNKIYENAFEWRFEFPEVLNDDGDFMGFDVVIGNPPYGVTFSQNEKQYYRSEYDATDDIYTEFIEKSIKISKVKGISSFILPVFWLTGDRYFATRKLILNTAHLDKGIILPYDVFSDAYVDTGIFVFLKVSNTNFSLVYEFKPKDEIGSTILNTLLFNKLEDIDWSKSDHLKIVFNSSSRVLSKKFDKHALKISDVTDSIRGILANPEDYSERRINANYEPVFVGKIDRYYIEEKFQFINYGDNLKEKPSSINYFKGERILVRRIVNRQFRIMATIASDKFVSKKDIYTLKLSSNDFSLKYILSIINSKLISFLKTNESVSAKKDDYTQLTLNDIRNIRLPVPTKEQQSRIEELVSQLLIQKKSSPSADTTSLESEIDRLVYELYGLTEEEIRIVEGKTV